MSSNNNNDNPRLGYAQWMDEYWMLNPNRKHRSENGILFSLEYFLLNRKSNKDTIDDRYLFDRLCKSLLSGTHFNQTPFGMIDHDGLIEPTSHDNLTAISAGSHFYGMKHNCQLIWSRLKEHYFTYSPKGFDKERIMHPRDIIFYGALAGNLICRVLLPLVVITNIVSCASNKGATSGKLLAWVRNECTQDFLVMRIGKRINDWQIRRMYDRGWKDVFKIYFPQEDNIIATRAEEVL